MFRKMTIAIASTALLSLASYTSANAAPINLAGMAKAKSDTELVQVRGGRGGGGGFRGGGRSFGGGHKFGGARHFGGGHRFHGRHHGHRHHKWKKRHYIYYGVGGGYVSNCGFYWRRWQATGSYHWRSKYYACIGY